MINHKIDVWPVPREETPRFINETHLIDKTLLEMAEEVTDMAEEDNIRVFVPLDLNKKAILRRLKYTVNHYGEANEANELEFSADVEMMIRQIEIFDQIWYMNPVVREAAEQELGGCDRIHIIEPIEVFDCHNFEARSFLCLTDSGGIQEECPSYGVPVLVMRDTTERPEGVDAGTLKLVGTDEETIYKTFKLLLENKEEYEKMSHACNPYGDGHACERIADILEGKKYTPWVAE